MFNECNRLFCQNIFFTLSAAHTLSMHLYTSDGRHAWFHLHGTSWPARSASEATKYKMKNSLSTVGLEPTTLPSLINALPTELAGLGECCPFKWPYSYMYSRNQCMHYYKCENDKGQRILSGKCTVLCYIFEYICECCTNSKETHKSCACFHFGQTFYLIWYLHVESKHRTYASLCYL